MKKYVMELIGTFFLVLTIGCTVVGGDAGVIPPLAIGMVLAVMVFSGGHVSGAHYNPAVTLAVFLRGRCPASDVAPYMVAQVAGAVLAAIAVKFLKSGVVVQPMTLNIGQAFVAEFLFTFALAFVVLSVATVKVTANNSFFGLAIGMIVLGGAFAVGGISGAVFNPAVAVGISILGLASWGNIWLYFVANLAAGAAAAFAFKALNPADK